MNYFDIIVLIPVLWFGYKGFTKGLVVEIATLAALLLGIWGGTGFSGVLSRFMTNTLGWTSEYIPVIAFALTFILIVIAVHLVARLVTKLVKAVSLSFLNRIAGALFGAAKVVLLISMLLVMLNQIDSKSSFLPEKMRSGSL
ncbi:MAG: CvpA family protein, partial [Bacteroidota bacterium]